MKILVNMFRRRWSGRYASDYQGEESAQAAVCSQPGALHLGRHRESERLESLVMPLRLSVLSWFR